MAYRIHNPETGEILIWDATSNDWMPEDGPPPGQQIVAPETVSSGTPAAQRIHNPNTGEVLVWDESQGGWSPVPPPGQDVADSRMARQFGLWDEQAAPTPRLGGDRNFLENMLIGSGRELSQMGAGLKDLVGLGGDKVKELESEKEIYEEFKDENPWAATAGEVLPYVASLPSGMAAKGATRLAGVAGKEIPKLLSKNMMPAALLPAATQPVGRGAIAVDKAKRILNAPITKNVAIGGTTGAIHPDSSALEGAALAGAGHVVGKAAMEPLSRVKPKLTKAQKEIVDWAKSKGFKLSPGAKTGDVGLQELDQALATRNTTAGYVEEMKRLNQKIGNRIAAQKLDLDMDSLDPGSLAAARETIGNRFNNLAKNSKGFVDKSDIEKLNSIIKEVEDKPGMERVASVLKKEVKKIFKGTEHNLHGAVPASQRRSNYVDELEEQFGSIDGSRVSLPNRQDTFEVVSSDNGKYVLKNLTQKGKDVTAKQDELIVLPWNKGTGTRNYIDSFDKPISYREMSGKQYQRFTKNWNPGISAGYKNGATEEAVIKSQALKDMKRVLDESLDKGQEKLGSTVNPKEWKRVKSQFRYLNDIEDAMTMQGSSGNISFAELYRNYMKGDRKRMLEGKMYDKDMEMLAKLGNLLSSSHQKGASLGTSQELSRMFNSGSKPGKWDLLTRMPNAKNVPFVEGMTAKMYLSGYPSATGALGLPSKTPDVMADLLSRYALGEGMGDINEFLEKYNY
jgi:hypothetical protein